MMKVVRSQRLTALGAGACLSTLAVACSFGSVDDTAYESPGPVDPSDSELDSPAQGDEVVSAEDPAGPASGDPGNGSPTADPLADDPGIMDLMADPQFQTDQAQQVLGVLDANCSGCHSASVALGGVADILDFQRLIDGGKLVMGKKEDSAIFTRMKIGTMPPASSQQRPTAGDVALVGDFIDGLVDPNAEECAPLDFMTEDEKYALLLRDILAQDAEDRPFIRYLGATYSSNAGDCGSDLQRQRYALFKMINSVSLNSRIVRPQPIDSDELIYRIDIRDYRWDRPIDLEDDGVVDFDDAWLATIDQVAEYAVEFAGDEADEVKQQTQTAVPFLSINAWVQDATTGDLYYALIDGRQNIKATEADLGIDEEESVEEGTLWRAGFKTSGVSKQDRNLTRQEIGNYQGSYWLSQDFADVASESSFADPLGFAFNGGEAIYNLPNGMQAYYATNDDGDRAVEVPVNIVIDPAQNNGVVTNAASCHSCHNSGMIPFKDTVRQYVESNPLAFDAETYEGVMEQFPQQPDFDRVVEEDSERHLAAVERAGVPRGTADPVSRVFLQFQLGGVDARTAAGELGVSLEVFLENLERLDPVLSPLAIGGQVERTQFTAVFVDSYCIMQSSSQNRPANCQ